ncbi:hypothetical protein M514_03747 [Trichuris suis]|uniref:Uncharacterized protein n=1 Tax=Trichuris suis TaxID=68888 RepID=A0A085MDW1_9BILA|nr:hypothetical protein M513_03747 [Trichuris suis]KFD68734.1 hypothetical protein M514_03747 [Trichuris suis]
MAKESAPHPAWCLIFARNLRLRQRAVLIRRDVNYAAAPLRTLKCRERGKENAPIRLSDEAIGRRRDIWKATMALCRMSRDDLALFLSGSDEFLLSEREALPKRARFNYINGPVFFLNMVSFEFTYETDRAQPVD